MPQRAQWTTTLAPVRGLDTRIPAVMQDRQYSPLIRNMRLVDGELVKRPGLSAFGNVRFKEPISRFDQFYKFDGTSALLAFSQAVVYKYNTGTTGWSPINAGLIVEDCEDVWNEQVVSNVTGSVTTDNVNGTNAVRFTIDAAFTTGIIGSEVISKDLTTVDTLSLMLRTNVATSAGDIKVLLDDSADCASPLETLAVPALVADEWTAVNLTLDTPAGLGSLISIGLQLDTDLGAQVLDVDDVWGLVSYTGGETDRWSSDFFNDAFYFTNGVDAVQQYTLSGQATSPTDISDVADTSKVVRSHGSRLNLFHTIESGTAIPQRHRYAGAGGIDMDAAGAGSGDYFEGSDWIIDAVPLGNRMVVYKERSINSQEHVGGDFVFRRERVVNRIGVVGKDSVIDLGDSHLVLARDNIYVYSGSRNPPIISEQIRKEMYDIINDGNANRSTTIRLEEFNEAWFLIPTGSATWPNAAYVFNYRTNTWTRMGFGVELSALGYYQRESNITWDDLMGTWDKQTWRWDDRQLLALAPITLVGDSTGHVFMLDTLANADGTAEIDCIFDTTDTPYTVDHTRRFERFLEIAFEAKGTSVDVYWSTDEGGSYVLLETVSLTSQWIRYRVELDVTARHIRFRFRQTSTTGTLSIRHFETKHIPRMIL